MAWPIGFAHALERLRWGRLQPRFSFAQASGWLRIGKRWEWIRLSRPEFSELPFPAAGFRRRALFWRSRRALRSLVDLLAANIAMSGLSYESNHPGRVTWQNINGLPTGLAVSRGPTFVERTSLRAKAGIAWADVRLPDLVCHGPDRVHKHRRARPEKWPDRFCGNHPATRSAPQEIGSPALPLAWGSFGGHKRLLKYDVDHASQPVIWQQIKLSSGGRAAVIGRRPRFFESPARVVRA